MAKENLMGWSRRIRVWACWIVLASGFVLAIAACGEKTAPEGAPKAVAPAAQPAPPPAPEQEPPKTTVMQPPPSAPANPDEELVSKVKAALGGEGAINVHRIDVTSEGGVVTLYGTAENAQQRAKAEEVAAAVAGVRSVQNKLAIVAGS